MSFFSFLISIVIAIAFTAVLVGALGWRRPGNTGAARTSLFVFTLLFLFIWASAAWLTPVGPVVLGVAWVPLLIAASVGIVLLAATTPPEPRQRRRATQQLTERPDRTEDVAVDAAFGVFFWISIFALLAVIFAGYTVV